MPVVPASVRAPAPSTSLDRVLEDQALSLNSHAELHQAWSSNCRRILHTCSSKTISWVPEEFSSRHMESSNGHPGPGTNSETVSRPALHADLLRESWKAYTLALTSGRPVSTQQTETAPTRRAGGVSVASNGKSAGASSISPSIHQGFLRKMVDASDSKEAPEFHPVSILVDSGSQQEPLCSTAVAQRLGVQGTFNSYAV